MLMTKDRRCGDFVLKLGVNLVEAHFGGRTGGKTAIGIERDSRRRKILERRLDSLDDRLDRIDLARLTTDAAQTDLNMLWQLLEDRHVARAGRCEFHRDVANLQAAQLAENRIVTAAMFGLAAGTRSARRQRCTAKLRAR